MGDLSFDDGFFAMVFSATGDTIKTEKQARKQFELSIIPTPREISKSCGFAIRFINPEEDAVKKFFDALKVPSALYFLSARNEDGMRMAKLLGEHK